MLKLTNLAIGGQKQRNVHCRAMFWQLQHLVQSFLQLQCISSYRLVWPQVELSSILLPSLTQLSISNSIHLVMEAPELQSSSGPSNDQSGKQPSWWAGWVILCREKSINCAAFLSESCFFASLTCRLLLVWTYSKTTNHFSSPHSSMICKSGLENKAPKVEVTSSNTFQVSNSTSKKNINKHMRHITGNLMSSKKS